MNSGKINLMATNPLILHEQFFVPIAGPSFVHDLGSDLGLKIYGGGANDIYDRFHPPVFIPVEKGRVLHQELEKIKTARFLYLQIFMKQRLEFGVFSCHIDKEIVVSQFSVLGIASIV